MPDLASRLKIRSIGRLDQAARRLLGMLLPSSCILCSRDNDAVVCAGCHQQFMTTCVTRCRQCARGLPASLSQGPGAHACGACLRHPPPFDSTLAAVSYEAPLDRIVLSLKYGGQPGLAQFCAGAMMSLLDGGGLVPDYLCPVPLGKQRLAERGYNQALELARPLAQATGIEVRARLLVRIRETEAQAQLSAPARRKNIKGAFTIRAEDIALVRGRHIGVVDDVMTTGVTLSEVAATLKRFGAARVTNIVFARTPV